MDGACSDVSILPFSEKQRLRWHLEVFFVFDYSTHLSGNSAYSTGKSEPERSSGALNMPGPALHLQGERTSGQDVRTQNVTAVATIANIVKSSLGPAGLDKMLVDDIGDVTITNDGATILKLLEVEQPAAKVRCRLIMSMNYPAIARTSID